MNIKIPALIGCAVLLAAMAWMVVDGASVPAPKSTTATLTPPSVVQKERVVEEADSRVAAQQFMNQHTKKSAYDEPKAPAVVIPQENLSRLYLVKCSACHGRDGKGPVGDPIVGKSYEYNLQKLHEYKANAVQHSLMGDMLTKTSEQDLEMLAREVSSFK